MSLKRKPHDQGKFPNGIRKKQRHDPKLAEALASKVFPNPLPPLPPIDAEMLKVVLTHPSVVPESDQGVKNSSYTQLEFLGDSYIEVIASRLIWARYDNLSPGRMSQLRQSIVTNKCLGEIATRYGLVAGIRAVPDVRASPLWEKVKGDVLEAYVAAMALGDEKFGGPGFQKAEEWLCQLWIPRLPAIERDSTKDRDSKQRLARAVVSPGVRLNYTEVAPPVPTALGENRFCVGVFITGWGLENERLGSGQGTNRTLAGASAAAAALENPMIEKLSQTKREYDEKKKQQQEQLAAEQENDSEKGGHRKQSS